MTGRRLARCNARNNRGLALLSSLYSGLQVAVTATVHKVEGSATGQSVYVEYFDRPALERQPMTAFDVMVVSGSLQGFRSGPFTVRQLVGHLPSIGHLIFKVAQRIFIRGKVACSMPCNQNSTATCQWHAITEAPAVSGSVLVCRHGRLAAHQSAASQNANTRCGLISIFG